MSEFFVDIPGSKYGDCVIIEEYNGIYSVVSGQTGKDGNQYKRWGFPQNKDRGPVGKAIPWKITLGDRRQASEIISKLYHALNPGENRK